MFGQIAQAIAKIYGENEQTKRNAVNTVSKTATSAGDGSNGQNYQVSSGTDKPTETNTPQPKEQDMSANETLAQTMKNAQPNFSMSAPKTDDDKTDEEDEKDDNSSMGGGMDAMSDERLKNIFGDNEDAIKAFAKINAIKFTYNDKAHEIHPNGEHQVDNDVHYGVKAQDLAKNPFTASTVETDEKGYMAVNTPELTMANSAVISELCKRLEIIEKVLGIKVV